jgi:hypothetical protein
MNAVTALSAFIIGIAGGDNVTLQHLDHAIAWTDAAPKQQTLTVKPIPVIRYQIGKPSAKAYAENSAIRTGDSSTVKTGTEKEADAKTGLSQAEIDKRVGELIADNNTLYFTPDNKPIADNPLQAYSRLATVYFFINNSFTDYKINSVSLVKSKPVYLLGFASPDGEAPRLQTDLAIARAEYIKSKLEKLGYKTVISGAALCNRCWLVEIYQ